MKSRLPLLLICSALLSGCSGFLPQPISRFELQTPRPFGYVIGDEIRHRVIIETRQDVKLNPNSIPARGEINRWLNLTDVNVAGDTESGDTVIDLTYQVFYAPNEVKMLTIPGFKLQFTQAGKSVEQAVPAWHFTLSPLKELAVRKDDAGQHYMRPDALPEPLSNRAQWLGFYASLSMTLMMAVYLAYSYGYFPAWPKRRIFKRALSQLGKLPENQLERGLAVVHHAMNGLNGQPLFKHGLEGFYLRHPEYRSVATELEWFFDFSNRVLFAGQAGFGSEEWQKLSGLCRLCREIECGKR